MSSSQIPDKLYFKIGEVSNLIGVKPYVLRYWESEFKDIAPVKSRTNQRLYKRRDVEILLRIRELLYRERFTINGAKKKLKEEFHGRRIHEDPTEQLGFNLDDQSKWGDLTKKALHDLKLLREDIQKNFIS